MKIFQKDENCSDLEVVQDGLSDKHRVGGCHPMGVFCEAHVLTCNVNGLRRQNWIDVDMERERTISTLSLSCQFLNKTQIFLVTCGIVLQKYQTQN